MPPRALAALRHLANIRARPFERVASETLPTVARAYYARRPGALATCTDSGAGLFFGRISRSVGFDPIEGRGTRGAEGVSAST